MKKHYMVMAPDEPISGGDTGVEADIEEFLSDATEVADPVEESSVEDIPAEESTGEVVEPVVETTPTEEVPTETVETPVTEATPEVEPPSEIESLKAQIAALQAVIEQTTKDAGPKVPDEVTLDLDSIVSNADFDEIMESKEKFMGFIVSAIKAATDSTVGHVKQLVPSMVKQQTSMERVRDDFYKENPELSPVRGYVATVANDIASKNPEWNVGQVLTEAAKVTKEALKISSVTQANATPTPKPKPTLPGGTNASRQPAPKKSKLQEQIDDFISD